MGSHCRNVIREGLAFASIRASCITVVPLIDGICTSSMPPWASVDAASIRALLGSSATTCPVTRPKQKKCTEEYHGKNRTFKTYNVRFTAETQLLENCTLRPWGCRVRLLVLFRCDRAILQLQETIINMDVCSPTLLESSNDPPPPPHPTSTTLNSLPLIGDDPSRAPINSCAHLISGQLLATQGLTLPTPTGLHVPCKKDHVSPDANYFCVDSLSVWYSRRYRWTPEHCDLEELFSPFPKANNQWSTYHLTKKIKWNQIKLKSLINIRTVFFSLLSTPNLTR